MKIETVKRTKDNQLPAYAWPGGYSIIYLDKENSTLCSKCATKSLDESDEVPQFKPIAYDIYYEGPTIQCDQCNVDIESAYGDPDNPELTWDGNYPSLHLKMTLDQAESGSHQGQCDDDVKALSEVPVIAEQLAKFDVEELRLELKEYGAWDANELADHDANLQRILWLACCSIKEEHNSKE